MTVRLSCCVMHHESRPESLAMLEADLRREGVTYEVVKDPEPFGPANPWRTARLAWQRVPDWATHHLVIQDDGLPCEGFGRASLEAITHKPDGPVSFFTNHAGMQDHGAMSAAASRCEAWFALHTRSWIPTLALALPRAMAVSLGAFKSSREFIADDEVVGDWCQHNRIFEVWQTIPSLVQHDEEAISCMAGHRVAHNRAASCWIGDASVDLIDWSRG